MRTTWYNEWLRTPAGRRYTAGRYHTVHQQAARRYQIRTQKNRNYTFRIGKEQGRVVSVRVEVAVNAVTGTVCVICALWHQRAIYPSRGKNKLQPTPGDRRSDSYGRRRTKTSASARRYQIRAQRNKTLTFRIGKEQGRVISVRVEVAVNLVKDTVRINCALCWYKMAIYPSRRSK